MGKQSDYMEILKESLLKKLAVLDEIMKKNEEQAAIIKEENMNTEAFDKNIEEKAALINKINDLDEGFESVYAHVKAELSEHKAAYKNEILQLQKLIGEITDKSVTIEASENRNKQLVEKQFRVLQKGFRKNMVSVQAANSYYRNMSKVNYVDPQLLDQKK